MLVIYYYHPIDVHENENSDYILCILFCTNATFFPLKRDSR